MVTALKNDDGLIYAYCEWRLVGPSGLEVPSGEYIWVNDIWVHKDYRNKGKVNRIVDEIMDKVPQAQYCYFQRKDYNNKVRIYSRRNWERRRMSYDIEKVEN